MTKDEELEQLCKDLQYFDPNWEPEEWEIQKEMDWLRQHHEEERIETMIFDAGSGKKMKLGQFERFYGTDEFSKELLEASKARAQYSKETAGKIKRRYNELAQSKVVPIKKPLPETSKPIQSKPKKEKEGQFLQVKYDFVEKVKDAGCHQNPTALLMILLKHRSWPGKMDKHHTYTHWYKGKGLIVASRSVEQLAEDMGVSEKTIRRWLNELEENGDIRKDKGNGGGYKRDNIYILGEIDPDGVDILFYHQKLPVSSAPYTGHN